VEEKTKLSTPCRHSLYGRRAAPWCKLVLIFDLIDRNKDGKSILWIDTDAAFVKQELDLNDFINNYEYWYFHENSSFVFENNWPWSKKPMEANSGIFVVRPTLLARCFLQDWWNNDIFDHHYFNHPFEQQALQKGIATMHNGFYNNHFSVLDHVSLTDINEILAQGNRLDRPWQYW